MRKWADPRGKAGPTTLSSICRIRLRLTWRSVPFVAIRPARKGAGPPVGLGRDGDQLMMRNRAASFGSYRQALVELALEETLDKNQGKGEFVRRVVTYFKAAGIDPAQPDRHVNIEQMIRIAAYIEWCLANQQRIPENLKIGG
jgi:hypothetical protein